MGIPFRSPTLIFCFFLVSVKLLPVDCERKNDEVSVLCRSSPARLRSFREPWRDVDTCLGAAPALFTAPGTWVPCAVHPGGHSGGEGPVLPASGEGPEVPNRQEAVLSFPLPSRSAFVALEMPF